MHKVAQIVKRAKELSKLTPKQRALIKNSGSLKKLASWVITHPELAKQLRSTTDKSVKIAMSKKSSANEPKFTLSEALRIVGTVAGSLHKTAQAKVAAEEAAAQKLARIMKRAAEVHAVKK